MSSRPGDGPLCLWTQTLLIICTVQLISSISCCFSVAIWWCSGLNTEQVHIQTHTGMTIFIKMCKKFSWDHPGTEQHTMLCIEVKESLVCCRVSNSRSCGSKPESQPLPYKLCLCPGSCLLSWPRDGIQQHPEKDNAANDIWFRPNWHINKNSTGEISVSGL